MADKTDKDKVESTRAPQAAKEYGPRTKHTGLKDTPDKEYGDDQTQTSQKDQVGQNLQGPAKGQQQQSAQDTQSAPQPETKTETKFYQKVPVQEEHATGWNTGEVDEGAGVAEDPTVSMALQKADDKTLRDLLKAKLDHAIQHATAEELTNELKRRNQQV